MMWRAGLALGMVELAGGLALSLVCSHPGRLGPLLGLGLSFGSGLIALSLGTFVASLCGVKPSVGVVLSLIVLLATAAGIARGRGAYRGWLGDGAAGSRGKVAGGWRVGEVLLSVFIVSLILLVSLTSLLEPVVEWDVLAVWVLKAKVLVHEPIARSGYFIDTAKAYSHLDYPLLWPLTLAWVWTAGGPRAYASMEGLNTLKVLVPALLCAFAVTFQGFLGRSLVRLPALIFTAVLLGLPMLLSQTSRLLADAPLAFFTMAAFLSCRSWLASADPDDLRLAGLFAGGMLFTKNEGVGLCAVLLVACLATLLLRRDLRRCGSAVLWLALFPLTLTGAWFAFRMGIPKLHEDYGSRLDPVLFFRNLYRLPVVMVGSLDYLGDFHDWLGLWPVLGLVALLAGRRALGPPACFMGLSVVSALILYGYVYVVTPWDVRELMESSANRLLLHLAPLGVFLMAELFPDVGRARPPGIARG